MDSWYVVEWVSFYTSEIEIVEDHIEDRDYAIKLAIDTSIERDKRAFTNYAGFAFIRNVFYDSDYIPEPKLECVICEGEVIWDNND